MCFTLYCFLKVFGLKHSGQTANLIYFFNGVSHTGLSKVVAGKTSPENYRLAIALHDEAKEIINNEIKPGLIKWLYNGLINLDAENDEQMIKELLAFSLKYPIDDQCKMYERKKEPEVKEWIRALQSMEDTACFVIPLEGNYVQAIKVSDFYEVRKEIIKNIKTTKNATETAKEETTLYISGPTLKDAFSVANSNVEKSIINDIFSNTAISQVNIYLLNYLYVKVNREDASKEIETTILNILDKAATALTHNQHCPKINIVLLNDFGISFSLLTEEKAIKRNTYLFTQNREFKGQYLEFGNQTEEYKSLKRYLDHMLEKSYNIDLDSNINSSYSIKERIRANASLKDHVEYKKIHPQQIENLVRSTFIEHYEKDTTDIDNYIVADDNQRILLPYLKQTEELLEKLVKKHDGSGWAKVIPAPDLGFPNNVTRIAGGFLTGALYDWSCSVPIIPIDATVNTCTSSVFRLTNLKMQLTENEFHKIVETIRKSAMDIGYAFNFKSGNHFITLAKDDCDSYYLILHSSAKQSKESCFGLYPSERAWFKDSIKTIYNDDGTRYLRYIRGDAAVRFYDYAVRFREFNEEIHRYVSEQFAALCNTKLSNEIYIKHHYGMPTATSIAIGTFVINVDDNSAYNRIVPIFSDYGKDIYLYEAYTHQEKTYILSGTNNKSVLIPHGWGQVVDNISDLMIENVRAEECRKLILRLSDNSTFEHPVCTSERLTLPQKHIRNFKDVSDFLKQNCKYLNGKIYKKMHPVFCHCSRNGIGN